ncbi:MAG: hypothetical protein KDE19_23560, partial [Caldilineaceae bacterium]|nr:hypothetical protein [Caldilineaceae bacterium]
EPHLALRQRCQRRHILPLVCRQHTWFFLKASNSSAIGTAFTWQTDSIYNFNALSRKAIYRFEIIDTDLKEHNIRQ